MLSKLGFKSRQSHTLPRDSALQKELKADKSHDEQGSDQGQTSSAETVPDPCLADTSSGPTDKDNVSVAGAEDQNPLNKRKKSKSPFYGLSKAVRNIGDLFHKKHDKNVDALTSGQGQEDANTKEQGIEIADNEGSLEEIELTPNKSVTESIHSKERREVLIKLFHELKSHYKDATNMEYAYEYPEYQNPKSVEDEIRLINLCLMIVTALGSKWNSTRELIDTLQKSSKFLSEQLNIERQHSELNYNPDFWIFNQGADTLSSGLKVEDDKKILEKLGGAPDVPTSDFATNEAPDVATRDTEALVDQNGVSEDSLPVQSSSSGNALTVPENELAETF